MRYVDNISKEIGDEVSGKVVKERFTSLFNLSMEKNIYVKDMVLGIGVEGDCWSWTRNLFVS